MIKKLELAALSGTRHYPTGQCTNSISIIYGYWPIVKAITYLISASYKNSFLTMVISRPARRFTTVGPPLGLIMHSFPEGLGLGDGIIDGKVGL